MLVLFLCLSISCSRYRIHDPVLRHLAKCRDKWRYFKLDRQVRGKVLSYAKGLCGYFMLNSAVVIVTSVHDTIRVLELPCYHKMFARSDSVLIEPVNKPDSAGSILDVDFTCLVKRTCYGHITKVE